MILYIDTADFKKAIFAVADKKILKRSYRIDPQQSHKTLRKLAEFLGTAKIKLSAIKKIVANKGPGSYTGVRVGVTHAKALGFALEIPVKFLSKEKFKIR